MNIGLLRSLPPLWGLANMHIYNCLHAHIYSYMGVWFLEGTCFRGFRRNTHWYYVFLQGGALKETHHIYIFADLQR